MKLFVTFSSSVVQLPVDRISDVTVPILLAAGAGSRFTGAGHKLDATIAGRSVAQRAIAAALESGVGPLLVVTGANPITLPDGATEVLNPDWAAGQMTSVRRGIDAARELGATAVVIGLADQPFVTAEAWRAVAASTSPIAVATYDGRRGNPVRLHESVWHLLPESGDEGARALIRVRPDLVEQIPCRGFARRHRHRGGSAPMAEQLVNEFTVNRPIEEAWPVICDVERIAPCMPGAQLEEIEGDVYRGVVKIKLGAVSTQFKGQAQFVERDDVNHRASVEGRRPRHRGPGERRRRHHGRLRAVVADEHQVHRHDRPPHHRQGGAVRPRHHGRRQQEADGAVLGQPEHDARQHRPRQHAHDTGARQAGSDVPSEPDDAAADTAVRGRARRVPRRRATDPRTAAPTKRIISGPATEPIDVAGMAGPALLKRIGPVVLGLLVVFLLLRRRR